MAYLPDLGLHAPVLAGGTGAILAVCTVCLSRDRIDSSRPPMEPLPPIAAAERRLAVTLALMLGLWMTDGVHPIPPAWGGLDRQAHV